MFTHQTFDMKYAKEIAEYNNFVKTRVAKKLYSRFDLHSVYLTHEGHVYTRGFNSHGQLGLGDEIDRNRKDGHIMPLRVPGLENIIDIHTGSHHTFCMDKNLKPYAWGCNSNGQLGLGHNNQTVNPTLVEALADRRIIAIEMNAGVTYFLDEEGCVYSCGYFDSSASTGLGNWVITYPEKNPINTPTRIYDLPPIKTIRPLGNHVFFLTEEGEVFGCGRNSNGQLGVGDNTERYTPVRLNLPPVKQIDGNWEASFFLTKDGRVFACGKDKVRQISLGLQEDERRDDDYYNLVHLTNICEPIIKMQPCGYCGIFLTEAQGVFIHYRQFDHSANDIDEGRLSLSEFSDFSHINIPVPHEVDITCPNKWGGSECLYAAKSFYRFGPGSETANLCHRKLGIPLSLKLLSGLSFLKRGKNKNGADALIADLSSCIEQINMSRENEKRLSLR